MGRPLAGITPSLPEAFKHLVVMLKAFLVVIVVEDGRRSNKLSLITRRCRVICTVRVGVLLVGHGERWHRHSHHYEWRTSENPLGAKFREQPF